MKKILFGAFVVGLFALTPACNFVDYDLNTDPNNPSDVGMPQLLPAAEVGYAYNLGGDMGRYISLWSQHHMGGDRQHLAIDVYQLTESDINNLWGNIYGNVLSNLKIINEKAAEAGSPHYAGVAKVLTAMNVAHMVDMWDNVPYSEANQFDENINPKFDNGNDLYRAMIALCDEAVTDLGATSNTTPGADDLVYGGDKAKWTRLARSTKARLQLRLSKVDGDAHSKALASLDAGGLASNDDNAGIEFGESATSANPWFQFDDQRGDVCMGGFFIDLMNTLNDPRRAVFATTATAGGYAGAHAGVPAEFIGASRFGSYYGSINSPVYFMTYPEVKFMEAECALDAGDKIRAANAHNDAVKASLDMFGVTDADYITANASETDATITLEKIMTQKYIALYTSVEPFNDWRRTGLPALPAAQGQSQVARRWPIAQDERVFNNANAQPYLGKTVFDRVFWDVQ